MEIDDSYQNFLQILGQTIRDLRKERGYTQLELANKAQRNQSSVAKVENTPPADLSLRVIYELARGLSVTVSDLLHTAEMRCRSHLSSQEIKPDEYWKNIQGVVNSLPEERKTYVQRVISEVISGVQKI